MADEAKIWSNQRGNPIYLGRDEDFRLPFKEKWRIGDAIAALVGFIATAALVTTDITAGHWHTAVITLIAGTVLTVAAVVLLGRLPAARPAPVVRAIWLTNNLLPRIRQ